MSFMSGIFNACPLCQGYLMHEFGMHFMPNSQWKIKQINESSKIQISWKSKPLASLPETEMMENYPPIGSKTR